MQSFDDYQEFAEAYVKDTESNSHNAYYERPAMFSVLEKLKFNKVLDAGCAGGGYIPNGCYNAVPMLWRSISIIRW